MCFAQTNGMCKEEKLVVCFAQTNGMCNLNVYMSIGPTFTGYRTPRSGCSRTKFYTDRRREIEYAHK